MGCRRQDRECHTRVLCDERLTPTSPSAAHTRGCGRRVSHTPSTSRDGILYDFGEGETTTATSCLIRIHVSVQGRS